MADAVYLDNAATTPVDPRVFEAMRPYWLEEWGNPSSVYAVGRRARRALDDARDRIAQILNCRANEIFFTSCGSESDNLAIRGAAMAQAEQRGWKHIVTSRVEHHAALHACQWLEQHMGFEVTYLEVDQHGQVDTASVAAVVRPDTALVSIMYANNEIGTIEPIAEIVRVVKGVNARTLIHTDAVQAGGLLPLDVQALGVDLLALSGHKFYAPKGVGLLFVARGTPLVHQLSGGGQERGVRAGTENVPYIVGMATALELAYADLPARVAHVTRLRDRLINGIGTQIVGARLTGHPTDRMPNSASFTISGADGESLLLNLDQEGICASSGAACTSGTLEISHVLRALRLPDDEARGSLRLTTGVRTTDAEVDRLLEVLPAIVERVREVTPSLVS
ncbi:MAG TPA: aminotransferase class V-fold PLP-dependent enzyme [Chloroflexota bacterium]|jgi:cysteine desulfurase|nr:aminotransferase class V-fold PLP-dependent enzyme [Chloroflexota bacterium]